MEFGRGQLSGRRQADARSRELLLMSPAVAGSDVGGTQGYAGVKPVMPCSPSTPKGKQVWDCGVGELTC
jgi:hypothetical protein